MLTYLTKNSFVSFLLTVNDGERQIEVIRQILNEQEEFEPYAAFKRIDRYQKGTIDCFDIQKFLADNNIHHSERDCDIYIQRYDNDRDGQLIYNEFLNSVLSSDNATLRAATTQRPNYEVDEGEYLLYDIEYALSKVIDKEIMFYLNLDDQKQYLLKYKDFTYGNVFNNIDKYSTGVINYDNLKSFFKAQAIYPSDEEIIAILRRLDRDDDALITFDEFVEALEPIDRQLKACANRRNAHATKIASPSKSRNSQLNSPSRKGSPLKKLASPSTVKNSPMKRTASPARKGTSSAKKSIPASPLRKRASPVRKEASPVRIESSPIKRRASPGRAIVREASPVRREASPLRREASPDRVVSPLRRSVSPSRRERPSERVMTASEIGAMSVERRALNNSRHRMSPVKKEASPVRGLASVERSGTDYALIRGFSPIRKATSPMLTQQNESFMRESALVSPNKPRVTDSPGLKKALLYQDFPKTHGKSPVRSAGRHNSIPRARNSASRSRIEAQTPEKRSPARTRDSSAQRSIKKNLSFDENIGSYVLIQTLKQFIILDKEVEIAKQDVVLKSDFNLLDFFRTFDITSCGSVSKKEFEAGIHRYGIYPNKDDLDLLFKKLNSNDDGLLRFSDFSEIFTPKQSEYANLLHNRSPSNIDNAADVNKVFSKDTKTKTASLIKLSLENEASSEALRQRLRKKGDMNGNEAFRYLDLKGDGFITSEELFGVFQENESFLTEREVQILMDRLDQDKDGRISYYELLRELTPKCE